MRWFLLFIKSLFYPERSASKPVKEPARETPPEEYQFKPLLGIIVGHERKSPGAVMAKSRVAEYFWNKDLAEIMQNIAKQEGKIRTEIIYRDGIGREGAAKRARDLGCDAVIELHFNAFNGKALGTETLCTTDKKDIEFSTLVQKHMCIAMERKGMSRGVKPISRSDRGATNVYLIGDIVNCLTEPGFGDNPDEEFLMNRNKNLLAKSHIDAVVEYFKV